MNKTLSSKTIGLFAVGLFAFVILMSAVSAVSVFSDDFSDGDLGGWTSSGTWTVGGTNSSAISTNQENSSLQRIISTLGHENIEISFVRTLDGDWETSDNFSVLWSVDGSSFTLLENIVGITGSDGSPGNLGRISKTFSLSTGASDKSSLTLRFECSTNAADEACILDDVVVSGTEIPEPSLSLSSATIPSDSNQTTITVTNNGNTDLTNIELSASSGFEVTFNTTGFNLNAGQSASVLVTRTTSLNSLKIGSNIITITATAGDANGTSNSVVLTALKNFYVGSNEGKLRVFDIRSDTLSGFGSDDEFWYPLDEVEVEFRVENNGNWDIEDIVIEACLYDISSERCVLDEDDMDISNDEFNLDLGDDQRVRLTFVVNPEDLRAGNEDYTFFISAVGDIDDRDSPINGEETGTSNSKDIEIRTREEFIIIDNAQFTNSVSCGETVGMTVDFWNIGDTDLDNDEVFVLAYNRDLGINEVIKFPSGIDSMEYERVSLNFNIPSNTKEAQYLISMTAYDDENLGTNSIFENSENDESKYNVPLNVKCSSPSGNKDLSIAASLDSEAKAGKEMSVRVTLTNTANLIRSFVIEPTGYDSWAEVSELPSTMTVVPSGTGEGVIKFNVDGGASGTKTFTVNVYSGTDLVATQVVSVNIEPKSFLGITGSAVGGNAFLWGFGILNVILLLIIIFVAVRIARR